MKPQQRKARKSAFAFFVCFFGCLALLRIFGEVVPGCRDVDFWTRHGLLKNAMKEKKTQTFRVLMGSSRVGCGVQPRDMGLSDVTFNFAMNAGNAVQDYFRGRWLLDTGLRPRVFVLEAWSVGYCLEPNPKHWNTFFSLQERQLYSQWSQDPNLAVRPSDYLRQLPQEIDLPLRFFLPNWMPENYRRRDNFDALGWTPNPRNRPTPKERSATLLKSLELHAEGLSDFRPHQVYVRALRQHIELCQTQRVPVVLLVTPNSPAYRNHLSSTHQEKAHEFWQSLSKEYQIPIIDSGKWGTEDDFYDGFHVYDKAIEKYSRWLGQRLQELGY